jgi:tagatose 1,6-diphosphate aldolase
MRTLSVGKLRGLQQLANDQGIFVICAVDHRGSLRKMFDEEHPRAVSYRTMVNYKLDLCRALAAQASAVLLDPVYGAAQAIAARALPGSTGLLVSLEATDYTGTRDRRLTELLPYWSVDKVKRLGASAAKLLLYYRPDLEDVARRQLEVVRRLAQDCLKAELPFLVEPVTYPSGEDGQAFAAKKPQLVIETARHITALPIDVLKAEFPADLSYEKDEARLFDLCCQLNEASQVPWVILSAGVNFELFCRQVEIACKAGASGFLAGRALWQEAVAIGDRAQRLHHLQGVVAGRLCLLAQIANTYGTPWYSRLGATPRTLGLGETWHQRY